LESGNNHQPIIEALLFASEKPLPADRIRAILKDISPEQIEQAVEALNEKYRNGGHSIAIKKVAKGYRMYTIPDYVDWVKALFSHNRRERLSHQALEVLSIVAYKQPIVKSEIDLIRGVNSEGPVFTLLDRKLITIVGRKPAPGRPLLYGTTKEFLTHFGLNDVEDLPRMEELEIILKRKEAPSFAEEIYDNLSNDQQPDDNGEIPPDVSSGDPEIPMNHSEQVSPEVPSEDENK
jgi:segregation and condensation protein B